MLLRVLGAGMGIVILVVVVMVIGSYTFLPPFVERQFESDIQDRLSLDETPEVELNSEPPLNILAGKFNSGKIVIRGLDLEGIRPERVVVDLDPFNLDLLGSVKAGALKSEEPLAGEVTMNLSEGELTRLANTGNRGPTVQDVSLEPGRMTVDVQAQVIGVNVPVSVTGTLKLRARTLEYEPERISAFGVRLPQSLSDQLVSQSGFEYPLEDLPYGTDISDIRVEEGKVVVEGRIEDIPLERPRG